MPVLPLKSYCGNIFKSCGQYCINKNYIAASNFQGFNAMTQSRRSFQLMATSVDGLRKPNFIISNDVYKTQIRTVKTKQAVAKRFLKTGKGGLKYKHSGKSHLNTKKSRKRKLNLNKTSRLGGVMLRNMKSMLHY